MRARPLLMLAVFGVVMGCTIRFDWPAHRVEVALIAERDVMETVCIDGTELHVEAAELSVIASELVGCETDDDRLRNLPGLAILGPSLAFAHIEESTTVDATPRAVQTVSSDDVVIAELTPPPDRYCGLQVELGPHPADDVTMSQTTARFAGKMRGPDQDSWTPFEWRTGVRATLRLDFEEPLELGDKTQEIRFNLRPNIVRWFDLVDAHAADEEAAYRVLQAAVSSVELMR